MFGSWRLRFLSSLNTCHIKLNMSVYETVTGMYLNKATTKQNMMSIWVVIYNFLEVLRILVNVVFIYERICFSQKNVTITL